MVDGNGARDPHADHDLEIVASLLDRDNVGFERAVAVRQVAECESCAALLADLRSLATQTAAAPTPARLRDFQLTAADAARLREPVAAGARLTHEMTDTRNHPTHDTLLVASLADRTLSAADRERAEALIASCDRCTRLHTDLVAIRVATQALPTPARPHDYQLTPADAARLRPSGWRRWIAAIGSGREAVTRPLAIGLTTLGLAGLLAATVPSMLTGMPGLGMGSSAAASAPAAVEGAGTQDTTALRPVAAPSAAATDFGPGANPIAHASAAPSAAPPFGAVASPGPTDIPAPAATTGRVQLDQNGSSASGSGKSVTGAAIPSGEGTPATGDLGVMAATSSKGAGLSPLVLVSGTLLLLGLALFVLRLASRRLSD